jgi:hypothetical protein
MSKKYGSKIASFSVTPGPRKTFAAERNFHEERKHLTPIGRQEQAAAAAPLADRGVIRKVNQAM